MLKTPVKFSTFSFVESSLTAIELLQLADPKAQQIQLSRSSFQSPCRQLPGKSTADAATEPVQLFNLHHFQQ